MHRIRVIEDDITRLAVDAIVNAANERMLGGGGVDGAIHRAAGPQLIEACRALPELPSGIRCPVGESRITSGFRLPARYVIHTVGPIWRGGRAGERQRLESCYRSSLALARNNAVRSIAFPAISCGVYGYPVDRAASVAFGALAEFLGGDSTLERVLLVAFEPKVYAALQAAFLNGSERGRQGL